MFNSASCIFSSPLQQALAFLILCLGSRFSMAYFSTKYSHVIGLISIAIGLSFAWLMLSGSRRTAREACGETWWNNLRLVHGIILVTAGAYLLRPEKKFKIFGQKLLYSDVVLGALAWAWHMVFQ